MGTDAPAPQSFLSGVRVLEIADELGEYCGKVLAGLGADVIKVEPPGGEVTRSYGPFLGDVPGPERSLYFWHFNFGKRGIVLDFDSPDGQGALLDLAADADVVIDTRPPGYLDSVGAGYDAMRHRNPGIIYARISPFGDDGPWASYKGSDLVHLALGGVVMNCGYDPDPSGFYETPPIAPQMWQAYQIAGEMTVIGILGALLYRAESGNGQRLATSVHDAVAKQTETDVPDWISSRQSHLRQTCRHSLPMTGLPSLAMTKDGRWMLPYRTYLSIGGANRFNAESFDGTLQLLRKYGLEQDLGDEKYHDPAYVSRRDVNLHIGSVVDHFVGQFISGREIWREAQSLGLTWAPLRRPEENITDDHWQARETFIDVDVPEHGRRVTSVGAKWMAPGIPWRSGPRAPLVGEHTAEVRAAPARPPAVPAPAAAPTARPVPLSARRKPFALSGVRIVDLSWMLASGGACRFLAGFGAEVIKVEHASRADRMRYSTVIPAGGRPEREAATGPIPHPRASSPNRSAQFADINAGKLSVSLNLKDSRGRELLIELIRRSDVITEGFSPGTMDRLGLSYDVLREINPRIVYVQQSGMGQIGTYGKMRSYGQTGQALSGLSEMSGLPEPFPPAGIGYSYLDWFGAYNMANAVLAGLYRQRLTGTGCWIDSSQAETGMYLTGTAVLDYSANGRRWSRYGNRSPYKLAAPNGVYRAAGDDRWIAVSCFTEEEWHGLARVLGDPEWTRRPEFSSLASRAGHQDALDALVSTATSTWEPFALMGALQKAGVPAGVCQTAQDRYERDPQLAHLGWLVELEQSEIGRWPAKELPVVLSETPSYMGGRLDRSGPSYAEDNRYVYQDILGLSPDEVAQLTAEGVL